MKSLKFTYTVILINVLFICTIVIFRKDPEVLNLSSADVTVGSTSPSETLTECIVTIDGAEYNVAELKKTHSGGDVFVCNSDMTTTFYSSHTKEWLQTFMPKYLVK